MTIETKYNIGDEVWWKEDGIGHFGVVKAIKTQVFETPENISIQYGIIKQEGLERQYQWFSDFYSTKEELLKSL